MARSLVRALERRGYEVLSHGALAGAADMGGSDGRAAATGRSPSAAVEDSRWAWASERAARDVAAGRAERAVVCCWTGTGASIAANKVAGVRAALCADASTAAGARRWNDANVLALSLRSTSEAELEEILDAFFESAASADGDDRANIEHLAEIERAAATVSAAEPGRAAETVSTGEGAAP